MNNRRCSGNEHNNENEIEYIRGGAVVRRRVRNTRNYIHGNNSCGAENMPGKEKSVEIHKRKVA
jgi:hypothetical protein